MSERRPSLAVLFLFVVFLCCCEEASSICPWPCNPSEHCPNGGRFDASSCSYGAVLDACLCCTVCAQGPGERCDNRIQCGDGLRCLVEIPEDLLPRLSSLEIKQFPGTCVEEGEQNIRDQERVVCVCV